MMTLVTTTPRPSLALGNSPNGRVSFFMASIASSSSGPSGSLGPKSAHASTEEGRMAKKEKKRNTRTIPPQNGIFPRRRPFKEKQGMKSLSPFKKEKLPMRKLKKSYTFLKKCQGKRNKTDLDALLLFPLIYDCLP